MLSQPHLNVAPFLCALNQNITSLISQFTACEQHFSISGVICLRNKQSSATSSMQICSNEKKHTAILPENTQTKKLINQNSTQLLVHSNICVGHLSLHSWEAKVDFLCKNTCNYDTRDTFRVLVEVICKIYLQRYFNLHTGLKNMSFKPTVWQKVWLTNLLFRTHESLLPNLLNILQKQNLT